MIAAAVQMVILHDNSKGIIIKEKKGLKSFGRVIKQFLQ